MKIKFFIAWLLIVLTTSSCQQQLIGIFQKGKYESPQKVVEVPFVLENNLIIIPVEIQGKTYRFLLDTGAPNVVSSELSEVLNLSRGRKIKTVDSQGNRSVLEYVNIPKVEIGGAVFENTIAGIADLKYADAIACLNIDGLIGANLMKKAYWQIDSQKQIIRISSELSSLFLGSNLQKIEFSTEVTGTPILAMKLGEVEVKRLKFDTGSVGFVSVDYPVYLQLKESKQLLNERRSFGVSTVGLFGASSQDTIHQVLVKKMTLGDVQLTNQILDAKKSSAQLLGMSFIKNYLTTIDWKENLIYLEPSVAFQNTFAESFGFSLTRKDEKMEVSYLTEGSDGDKLGLKIGDIVLRVNDVDLIHASLEEYCEIIRLVRLKEVDALKIVVLREGQKDEFILTKLPLLNSLK